jgi:predicted RNA-binding Zn-ribbon protein involved in translation (DUF1610 family)
MGVFIDAHCHNCGRDWFVMVGSNMSNDMTFAARPVACRSCKAVTTANFKESFLKCLDCGSEQVEDFHDKGNWKGDGEKIVFWDGMSLADGHYRCPHCGEFELRFGTG